MTPAGVKVREVECLSLQPEVLTSHVRFLFTAEAELRCEVHQKSPLRLRRFVMTGQTALPSL